MHDLEIQNRFVQMRSQGRSFARIAQELDVSKAQEMDEAIRRVYGLDAAPPPVPAPQ